MDIGARVRVSENPWVEEPGGFVDPAFAGQVGTVVGPVEHWEETDDHYVAVEVEGMRWSQFISLDCLEEVTDE